MTQGLLEEYAEDNFYARIDITAAEKCILL